MAHRALRDDRDHGSRRDEDAAARLGAPLLVCDTDALATSVWHERYSADVGRRCGGSPPAAATRCTVLTGDDIPFVQDGTRDGEHLRGWMTQRFREVLADRRSRGWRSAASRAERLRGRRRGGRRGLGTRDTGGTSRGPELTRPRDLSAV
jgi:hypothetical protein